MSVIYSSEAYICDYYPGDAKNFTVLSFQSWQKIPSLNFPNFAEEFLRSRNIGVFSIRVRENEWYQNKQFDQVISAINREKRGDLVAYGISMGGYAALNYAYFFDFKRIVAFSPQYSLDPRKMPQEKRWINEAMGISFDRDFIGLSTRSEPGYIISDNQHPPDRIHVDKIHESFPNLKRINVPFGHHSPSKILLQSGILQDTVLTLLAGEYNHSEYSSARRSGRRMSSEYFLNLSKSLFTRKRRDQAFACARMGYDISPDDYAVAAHYANLMQMRGQKVEAREIFMRFVDVAPFSEDAKVWVDRCA